MRRLIFFILLNMVMVPTVSAEDWSFTFAPLYGVEHTQNRYPEPARASTRTFFGLRVLAGTKLLSLELEGTQANDTRSYPSENQKVEDEVQRLMVGARSTYTISSFLDFFLRAGGRGTLQKTTITDTATDEKETKNPPLQWDPYAGTGVQINLAQLISLNAGATWIFTDGGKPDVQYSLGFTLKFGQPR